MEFITSNIKSEGLIDIQSLRRDMTRVTSITDSTHYIDSSSCFSHVFDGTGTNFNVRLPDATSLQVGHEWYAVNDGNTYVGVYTADGTSIVDLNPRTRTRLILKDNTSSQGLWIYESEVAHGGQSGYSIYGTYNGNALSGRYLEIYPGTDSRESPYLIIGSFSVVALSAGTSANSTGTVSLYKSSDLDTAIASVSLDNQISNYSKNLWVPLVSGDSIVIKVSDGSLSKPYVTVYMAFAG